MNVNLYKKSLDFVGSRVDDLFLSIPNVLKTVKPARAITPEAYARQIDYYVANGWVKNPERFFALPDLRPEYRVESEVPFVDGLRQIITFDSAYECRNPLIRDRFASFENNRQGYLVRWTHGDRNRKTLLCLHGYLLGEPRQAERMFRIHKLFAMGLDIALFITPFHWRRAPKVRVQRGIFLQPDDVVMTLESFGQAMHDLQLATLILSDCGASEIGLIGASLGGYIAALFSCLSDTPVFAALVVPALQLDKPMSPDSVRLSFRPDAELQQKINTIWRLHSPLNFSPKIPGENILVIASRGDRLCPFAHVEMLREKWGLPRFRFMTGGHWLVFNAAARGKAWYAFLNEMGFATAR
ncbi:MAG: hypothetical protein R6X10_15195 [Desulfobacterales bacterium]